MEEEYERIHIRTGGKLTHAGVEMLPRGEDIKYIVIQKIEYKKQIKVNGKNQDAWIATFAPNSYTPLPIVLCKTNREILCKLANVSEWDLLGVRNFPVQLTKEKTSMGWGIRVSKLPPIIPPPPPPAKKDILNEAHANWELCIAHLKKGGTIDDLKIKYEISPATEIKLKG